MASERKFIERSLTNFAVKEFLNRELSTAGVSAIYIQKTPIATRIAITVRRPGLVVGKKGKTIREIAETLQETYKVENPQIEVLEVQNASLDAKLMAEKIARQLEMRGNVKAAMRFALREIMSAGAIGAEITAAGKLVGKGGKARTTTIRAGFLKKSGEESKKLRVAKHAAHLKAGIVGITVKLVPPGTKFSDQVDVSTLQVPAPEEEKKEEPEIKAKKKTRRRTAKKKSEKAGEVLREKEAKEAQKEEAKTQDAVQQPVEQKTEEKNEQENKEEDKHGSQAPEPQPPSALPDQTPA